MLVAECRLNWGSCGTMSPTEATAIASRQLDAAHKAAQVTCMMQDALPRGVVDRETFFAARKLIDAEIDEARKKIDAAIAAIRGSDSQA